jgi:hypothetical protein
MHYAAPGGFSSKTLFSGSVPVLIMLQQGLISKYQTATRFCVFDSRNLFHKFGIKRTESFLLRENIRQIDNGLQNFIQQSKDHFLNMCCLIAQLKLSEELEGALSCAV